MNAGGFYPSGRPCWFEIGATDVAKTRRFYSALLGWQYEDQDGFHLALDDGKTVAAVVDSRHRREPVWHVYLATDDIDATARAVVDHGGTIVVAPQDCLEAKRAVVKDATGGEFGLWQGRGLELYDAPGAVCWTEFSSTASAKTEELLGAVFGVGRSRPFANFDYVQLHHEGRPLGGVLGMNDASRPTEGMQAWLVYFQVADTDQAVDVVRAHGGIVIAPPEDMAYGRWAIVADPFGARLAVIKRDGADA